MSSLAVLPEDAVLAVGAHPRFGGAACALEWVDILDHQRRGVELRAGLAISDHPACTCPVIAAFVREWNDSLNDADRQRLLRPLVPRLLDTRSTPDVELQRAMLAADWCVRVATPIWLDLAGLTSDAAALRVLPEIRDASTAVAGVARVAAVAGAEAAVQLSAIDLLNRMLAVQP